MKEIISKITTDKLSWSQIELLQEEERKKLGENSKMIDVLWQNGGIGYIEEGPNGKIEVFLMRRIRL